MSFYTFADSILVRSGLKETDDPNAQYKPYWAEMSFVDRIIVDEGRPHCPACGREIGILHWGEPRKIHISGMRYPDRITHWPAGEFVFSERFKSGFEKEELTGIKEFLDIEVVRLTKRQLISPPPRYYSVYFSYSETVFLDTEKSIITGNPAKQPCLHCCPCKTYKDHVERIVLDAASWDGTDIFRVYGFGVVMSQRMHDFIVDYKLTNFNLVRIEDYRY